MVAFAPIAGLMMVTARITDNALKPDVFNKWYSDVHVRDMVTNNFATLAFRFANITAGAAQPANPANFTSASHYLALYKVPDINFLTATPNAMSRLPLNHESLPDKSKPVTTWSAWTFTYWTPIQTFEGKSKATTRPKYVVMAKMEPAEGGDDELDQWYRKQHLDMLSLLPSYRRSTRWKSSDGSKPRFVAIHEMDDVNLDAHTNEVLMGTEWAKKVVGGAKTFDPSAWSLFLEKGNSTEKL